MGACCSKEGEYATYKGQSIAICVNERKEEIHVIKGDYGASIMLQGFSDYASMATKQGKKGVIQDTMTVWHNFTGNKDVFFCGVFDGHGPYGHEVAEQVREMLPSRLSAAHKYLQDKDSNNSDLDDYYDEEDNEDLYFATADESGHPDPDDSEANRLFHTWRAGFLRSFREVDRELCFESSVDSYCSGTTAVTIVKQGSHLMIGNLGDSRAVMCTKGERGEIIPVQLTVDLKPNVPEEAERIKRCRGRVFSLEEESGVCRVWLPDEDSPGLAMARAFGDFCLKDNGLISVPQVFYRKLAHEDEFVVLATDGVWDVLTNFEVVKIVSAARARSMAAKFLVAHAVRAWRSRFPSSRTDDIAVVILYFKPPPPPPPPGRSSCMSSLSHISAGDSLSHLNSSVSHYTYRSLSSSAEEGFDFKGSFKSKSSDDWDDAGESLVDTTLNFPRYSSARITARSSSFKSDDV